MMSPLVQQRRGNLAGFLLTILSVHHDGVVVVAAIDAGFTLAVLTDSDPDAAGSDPGQNLCEFLLFSQSQHHRATQCPECIHQGFTIAMV